MAGGAEAAGRGGEAWTLRNEPGSGTRRAVDKTVDTNAYDNECLSQGIFFF